VNVIPFNPWPGAPYQRPSDETIAEFQAILARARLSAFIRKSKGRNILAACGQLRSALERPTGLIPTPQASRGG
jgi:23S rRNA (adenine2503-C2)-methyltransferase